MDEYGWGNEDVYATEGIVLELVKIITEKYSCEEMEFEF